MDHSNSNRCNSLNKSFAVFDVWVRSLWLTDIPQEVTRGTQMHHVNLPRHDDWFIVGFGQLPSVWFMLSERPKDDGWATSTGHTWLYWQSQAKRSNLRRWASAVVFISAPTDSRVTARRILIEVQVSSVRYGWSGSEASDTRGDWLTEVRGLIIWPISAFSFRRIWPRVQVRYFLFDSASVSSLAKQRLTLYEVPSFSVDKTASRVFVCATYCMCDG